MKILHAADLHVGCCRRYPDSLKRARLVFRDILRIVKAKGCQLLVVSGDWFDRPTPNHEERALVAELFKRSSVPIVSITGNHDKWGRQFDQTALNWLTGLAPKFGHRVWDKPTGEEFEGVRWIALPYNDWSAPEQHLLTRYLLDEIPEDWDGPVVGLAHEFFQGALLDSGYTGTSDKYAQLHTFPGEISYWALGDIHKMQKMASNAWYPGAPYQTSFGEKLPKGVLVVDLAKKGRPEFVEITSPTPMIELTAVPDEWPDAYVKLTVRPEDLPHPLPQCVVQIGSTSLPQDAQEIKDVHAIVSAKYLLQGMKSYLEKTKGWDEKMVKRGMRFARDLVKRVQPE